MKLVFYGDDFTGATDTLGTFDRAGLRVLLLPRVPSVAEVEALGPLDVLGIAGAARSMSPDAMRAELQPLGRLFAALRVPLLHYKTCSTFDSAPQLGSIGHAVSVLRPFAPNPLVAIVAGQPNLGRYCLFGNLFAALCTGGEVYRLDRHPTMREHPATPMHEADLRVHLRAQGLPNVVNVAYPAYEATAEVQRALLHSLVDGKPDALLFDVGAGAHLASIGRLVWQEAQRAPLLAVGPSGVAQALLEAWQEGDAAAHTPVAGRIGPAEGPVFVLAGSLSPVTARQVAAATSYERIAIDPARLMAHDADYVDALLQRIAALLRGGRHVLAATAPAAAHAQALDGTTLARECAALLARLLREQPLKRVGIAGGDTSSHAVRALGLDALSYLGELAPGVAVCRARAGARALDGIELMLKGGQVGGDDLFERLLRGG